MYIVQICIYLCILVQITTYVYSFCILYFFILQKTTQTHAPILTLIYANSTASTQCTLINPLEFKRQYICCTTSEGCGYSLTGVHSQLRANQLVTHTDFTHSYFTVY